MPQDNTPALRSSGSGESPFDRIRHTDAFGREYWLGREMQPLVEYGRWHEFAAVIEKAKASLALVQGAKQAEHHFVIQHSDGGRWGNQRLEDYRLTRFGAYLTAMAGDDMKPAVAEARVYFAVRAREAELGAITLEEKRQTALARAREMIDYQVFRDMMAENATDYEPSSDASRRFFANMQNRLYLHLTGMTAKQIKQVREICHWKGREIGKLNPTKAEREVAKNHLSVGELKKLNRIVARLCLAAEDIAEDGLHLSFAAWEELVDAELAAARRRLAA